MFDKSIILHVDVRKTWLNGTKFIDHDQTLRSVAFDLGLNCLRKLVCPSAERKYLFLFLKRYSFILKRLKIKQTKVYIYIFISHL